jgi:Xaa-Pro dipeptidase
MRSYRFGRVQRLLRDNDCSAALLSNPVNIRYATDARNMTVWHLHNTARYCLVPVDGKAVLFEFPNRNCMMMAEGLPAIGEIRPAFEFSFAGAGEHARKQSQRWAAGIASVIYELTGQRGGRLAVDRCDVVGMRTLEEQGFVLVEGQRIVELARAVKSADEIACMRKALEVADAGIDRMRSVLAPGMQENQLWAELHHTNIALGGEWIETRLLSSGGRTNPWFQECSERVIMAGDLVSFDTDLIGPFGYCADISRTLFCEPGSPSPEQRTLYALALEQVQFNCNLLRPRLGFRELTENAWKIPARFVAQNYGCVAHGVGMVDEWPLITSDPNDSALQEGELVPGMTLCVESYMGEVGGACGVKLEQQIQITATGWELLSSPLRDDSLTG